ncbi:MAG TPA: hypothetical protein VFF00_09785 [Candidatus Elarobacter sp.]|nr:hypothetical protein [Candidatus Elarobacter sp.]
MNPDLFLKIVQVSVALFLLLNIATGVSAALTAVARSRMAEKLTFQMLRRDDRIRSDNEQTAAHA